MPIQENPTWSLLWASFLGLQTTKACPHCPYSFRYLGSYFALGQFEEWKESHREDFEKRINSSYSSKASKYKIASGTRSWINSVPQTAATTFAFSSVFILLLWLTDYRQECPSSGVNTGATDHSPVFGRIEGRLTQHGRPISSIRMEGGEIDPAWLSPLQ